MATSRSQKTAEDCVCRTDSAFVGPLEHWHYNTFRAKWEAIWREPELVTFVLDAEGKPSAIELTGARFARVPEMKQSPR